VWWFVNPQGEPFFSIGVSDIGSGPKREKYDPQKPAYAAFRYYDSAKSWVEDTTNRLKSWNFNTLGSWVDPALDNGSMPYAVVLHLGAHAGVPWNDLFSDGFAAEMNRLAEAHVAPRANDHNLLGWFSDNELGWYPDTLFYYHLESKSNATRAKLIEILADHYQRDFAALSQDFEIGGASTFDDLSALKLKPRPGGKGRAVVERFVSAVAERYYQVMHDAIRRYDTNHLILGDRYPWHCPPAVAKAAGPFVDVISTNFDWPEAADGYLPCGYLHKLHEWTGRPVLVSEYYVAAHENRSGNKNTGGIFLTVDTQEARAKAARNRLITLAAEPYVIGAHWFRFADEPTHGRLSDGEDYNFGLVDIENRPYEQLVSSLARANSEIPDLHSASIPADAPPSNPVKIPPLHTQTGQLHRQLVGLRPLGRFGDSLGVYDVLAAWNPQNLFLVAMVCHVSEREVYSPKLAENEHKLELSIASPAMESPLRVRFGGAKGALADDPQVECWISANGLRHTLVVALPATRLGKPALAAGYEAKLQVSIRDLLDKEAVATWHGKCQLIANPGGAAYKRGTSDHQSAKGVLALPR
jgi:hypothetical protein